MAEKDIMEKTLESHEDVFADIVKQVKIEILNSAFFKLFFKNICGVVAFAYLMPGIFVRKKI